MNVRRWVFDKPCAVHSFLVQTPGVDAQISRGDSK